MMLLRKRWMYMAAVPVLAAVVPGTAWLSGRDTARASAETDKPGLYLIADLSSKRLKMYEADTLLWQYEISDGTGNHPTPTGRFRIRRMVWNPSWTPPPNSKWARKYTPKRPGEPGNPMKVVKIFFREPDYGCIRMDPEHIAEVARYLMQYGGQPRGDNWFMRVLRMRNQEKPIYLPKPIPLTIRR
jgi:lipoprotein-anchoring transpeptidase ErfK/SrfK